MNLGEIREIHLKKCKLIFPSSSFKTKGNLTKHMKSKAHFKKCSELGISPIPTMPDDDINEMDDCSESSRRMMMNGKDGSRCDSETEDNDSDDELDDDSGDEGMHKKSVK